MADHILDKSFPVLTTYNSSAVAGVVAFRCVKFAVASSTAYIDLQTTAAAGAVTVGVVQENVDQAKVATGKAVVNVRVMGVSRVVANTTPGSIVLGSKVMCGSAGGAVLAATAGSTVLGLVIGMSVPGGTVAAGDQLDVLLTPGAILG